MKFHRSLVTVCIALLSILSLVLPQLTAASASFSQNLQLRDTGDDVTRLQQFLNAEHFLIARSGPGSPGNETSIFGKGTFKTLIKFQKANNLPATGYLGPLTRALINAQAH
jgi:peptidoglycan hydrolase-like protein with peptidoglycan-binding domain